MILPSKVVMLSCHCHQRWSCGHVIAIKGGHVIAIKGGNVIMSLSSLYIYLPALPGAPPP